MACSRNSKGASGLDLSEERVGEKVSGGGWQDEDGNGADHVGPWAVIKGTPKEGYNMGERTLHLESDSSSSNPVLHISNGITLGKSIVQGLSFLVGSTNMYEVPSLHSGFRDGKPHNGKYPFGQEVHRLLGRKDKETDRSSRIVNVQIRVKGREMEAKGRLP